MTMIPITNDNFIKYCELGYTDIVKKFLEKSPENFDINARDDNGRTALIATCSSRNIDIKIVKFLLKVPGIDVNAKMPKTETTALMILCNKYYKYYYSDYLANSYTIEELLNVPDIDVNAKNINGYSALFFACFRNNNYAIKRLLEISDIDVNTKDNRGDTLLITLCGRYYNLDALMEILKRPDLDVNYKIDAKHISLFTSFFLYTSLYLLTKCAEGTYNALVYALANNSRKKINALLERADLDVNVIGIYGRSVLIWACDNCQYKIIRKLIKYKSLDYHIKDLKGFTAYDYASKRRHKRQFVQFFGHFKKQLEKDLESMNFPLHDDVIKYVLKFV